MKEDVIYTVTDEDALCSYPVAVPKGCTLEQVWDMQKHWFTSGAHVTIRSFDGKAQKFQKE